MTKVVLGLASGAVGIALLLVGLFSNHWVVGRDSGIDTHVGLRHVELCQVVQPDLAVEGEAVCSKLSHDDLANSPSAIDGFNTFTLIAMVTFYTGLACAGIVLILIILALARKVPDLFIAPSTLGILLSFGVIVLLAITLASHPWKKLAWGTGWSIMVAGGGAIACLFASIMLGRARPKVDDEW